jgi:hypothetical protein
LTGGEWLALDGSARVLTTEQAIAELDALERNSDDGGQQK